MTIKAIAYSVFVAGLLSLTSTAVTAQTTNKEKAELQDKMRLCEPHGPNATDCHVHDKKTYLHLKGQHPRPGAHARSEINELIRKERTNVLGR